jgi:hypothetical protein
MHRCIIRNLFDFAIVDKASENAWSLVQGHRAYGDWKIFFDVRMESESPFHVGINFAMARSLFPLNIVAAAVLADNSARPEIFVAAVAVWQNKFLFFMSSVIKHSIIRAGSEVKWQLYF